jgi:hypothetical protein
MQLLILTLGTLVVAAPRAAAEPVEPNAAVAKAHGGKVWVTDQPPPAAEGDRLKAALAEMPRTLTLKRQGTGDPPWPMHYVAVFKKPALRGPMTVRFFEKSDPRNIVDEYSPPNNDAAVVFITKYELSPDAGFNKGRTYVIHVGQLVKNKFIAYAKGEFALN